MNYLIFKKTLRILQIDGYDVFFMKECLIKADENG